MWLGLTAGPFALLVLWLFTSPVQAQSNLSTFSDQELTYLGSGWKTVNSPQVCNAISGTMHTTSTTGDFASFQFKGTGVIVHGPVTSRSIPLVIALDGAVQPLAAPKNCTTGCGILYVIGNLTDEPHIVQVGHTAVGGTVSLSICGISLFSTNGLSPSIIPLGPTTNGYGNVGDGFSSPQDSSESKLSMGMLAVVTVAIIGAVLIMVAVLILCVVVRRRISRNAARSRDQENSFGRGFRRLEDGRLDGPSDLHSADCSSFKESLSECVIIASGASTSVHHTSHLSTSSPTPFGSPLNHSLATTPTLIQTNKDPFTHTRQLLSPALVPDTPSEADDPYLLPSPRSGRSLLRYSIPIRIYNAESPHPSATVENPFESPRSSLRSLATAATEETSLSNSRVPSHILVFPFGRRISEISRNSTITGGATEG